MLSHSEKARVNNSQDVIIEIVRCNSFLKYLTLVTYQEGPTWRDLGREPTGADAMVALRGIEQDQNSRIEVKLSREEISDKKIGEIVEHLPQGRLLGVSSTVVLLDGRSAHVPMMDFICTPSPQNAAMLCKLIGALGQGRGALLESGRSYHYYGFRLLTDQEWRIFLGKCLLMSSFADDRYIGHQLVDGYCVLRLSSGKLKAGIPRVVAELT